jgi:hypothetical protein
MKHDFPLVSTAADLLKAMQSHPDFRTGQASERMTAFIDNADPNSSELSKDDTNQSWGHYQLTSGGTTFKSVLTKWEDMGNVYMACELIASVIKTCRIARHICFQHGITPGSYLSDSYLDLAFELLWQLWKDGGGVSSHSVLINYPFILIFCCIASRKGGKKNFR